jgi:hypothetical protein
MKFGKNELFGNSGTELRTYSLLVPIEKLGNISGTDFIWLSGILSSRPKFGRPIFPWNEAIDGKGFSTGSQSAFPDIGGICTE